MGFNVISFVGCVGPVISSVNINGDLNFTIIQIVGVEFIKGGCGLTISYAFLVVLYNAKKYMISLRLFCQWI